MTLVYGSGTAGSPVKNGSGVLKISKNGSVAVVGKLGDRTPFNCGPALLMGATAGPVLPVYSNVYRAPGNVSGALSFDVAATSDATGSFTAVKPVSLGKPSFSVTYDVTTAKP